MKILLADFPHYTGFGHRKALEAMGHEVRFFDHMSDRHLTTGPLVAIKTLIKKVIPRPGRFKFVHRLQTAATSGAFLDEIEAFRPDLILVVKGSMIHPDALQSAREKLKIPTACYFGEPLYEPELRALAERLAPHFDLFFILDEIEVLREFPLRAGHVATAPNNVDPEQFHPVTLSEEERRRYESDVAFVGILRPNRLDLFRHLARRPVRFRIWGSASMGGEDWKGREPETSKCLEDRWIEAWEMERIYAASKIVVNVHGLYGRGGAYQGLPMRPFEVTACGAFLLTDDCVQIRRLFRVGEEVDVYDTPETLVSKVEYYLRHESQRVDMARRAHERTLREHTSRARLGQILETARARVSLP
ncbi:MAG: glycosyltransferase [Nitrospirae bacterium]|nr:glycosyltransferase [Nitrospirota bacterium]